MSLELWLAFALASAAVLAVPGPTVMLVVSYALGRGRASGWATVPGVTFGDFAAMTISLLGAGAVLAASTVLFTVLKLVGAAYLVWLGVKLWRAKPERNERQSVRADLPYSSMFWNAFLVTALNPKSIAFFVAFVPQFVNPSAPVLMQLVTLEVTFVLLAAANATVWAALAGSVRSRVVQSRTLTLVNRIGGSFLIGAGFLTAALRKNG